MLLSREKKIIKLLYEEPRYFTTYELSLLLEVSPRTVKSDIKGINEIIKKEGCYIETKTNYGVRLIFNEFGKKFLEKLLFNGNYVSPSVPDVRKYWVAKMILDMDGFISIESISETFFVSKGTIGNDLNELLAFFQSYDLELVKKAKYGVKIIGEEKQIRIATADIIKKLFNNQNNISMDRLKRFFLKIDLNKVEEIIKSAEERFSFILSDIAFNELLIQIAITIDRINQNHNIQIENYDYKLFEYEKEWEITNFITAKIEESLSICLDESEKGYILIHLLGANIQCTVDLLKVELEPCEDLDTGLYAAMLEAINETSLAFNFDFIHDEKLTSALFLHLKAMFNRLNHGISINNPLLDMLKKSHLFEYEMAAYLIDSLMKNYNLKISEDEIGYVALHIAASVERYKIKNKYKNHIRVVIVCTTGFGTSQYMKARIQGCFPYIFISKILPINKAKTEIYSDEVDFVLSTVPLTIDGVDVIKVSPLLNDKDINSIKAKINNIDVEEKKLESNKTIKLFINERISIFKCDCRTRNEVIQLLGTRMIEEEYVDDNFISSVFNRENVSTTAIGSLLAIPHAFEGHVLKQGIGIMTLKKPIDWGDNKVQIILMLSIDGKTQNQFEELFTEVVNIAKQPALIKEILEVDNFKDFVNVI
ncbi:BglG family transcription antiterminator [Tissierella sp. MSJ-40]|uniref:BglG family transcription antiterminator n=1 Tax=Tissierella simiarum TaxID=2841534 RepID=A0ABS6E293_9FIRM|nr:BglG family transcription antiterminator [Tissierella simiarum]MBU5437030.1 BglG family transcription antiterminator [Tissierella simiarum]